MSIQGRRNRNARLTIIWQPRIKVVSFFLTSWLTWVWAESKFHSKWQFLYKMGIFFCLKCQKKSVFISSNVSHHFRGYPTTTTTEFFHFWKLKLWNFSNFNVWNFKFQIWPKIPLKAVIFPLWKIMRFKKKVFSNLEPEGQGHGIIMGVILLLLLCTVCWKL